MEYEQESYLRTPPRSKDVCIQTKVYERNQTMEIIQIKSSPGDEKTDGKYAIEVAPLPSCKRKTSHVITPSMASPKGSDNEMITADTLPQIPCNLLQRDNDINLPSLLPKRGMESNLFDDVHALRTKYPSYSNSTANRRDIEIDHDTIEVRELFREKDEEQNDLEVPIPFVYVPSKEYTRAISESSLSSKPPRPPNTCSRPDLISTAFNILPRKYSHSSTTTTHLSSEYSPDVDDIMTQPISLDSVGRIKTTIDTTWQVSETAFYDHDMQLSSHSSNGSMMLSPEEESDEEFEEVEEKLSGVQYLSADV